MYFNTTDTTENADNNCRYVITVTKYTSVKKSGFLGLRIIHDIEEDELYRQCVRKVNVRSIAEAVLKSLPTDPDEISIAQNVPLLEENVNIVKKDIAIK